MLSKRARFFLFTTVGCWLLVGGLPSSGRAASSGSGDSPLDVSFFYDQLKNAGSWYNTTEYGDVWQPYIAYKNDAWRPYTDGYWTYTDGGWMFVSYEDFGWAVYHYGRWTQLKDLGWAWVPGTEWSPAWVTWRESNPGGETEDGQPAANVAATTTDEKNADDHSTLPPSAREPSAGARENYIGWAPLPPDPEPIAVGEYYSYGPTVDIDYGIDPYDYCFTDVRFFGAPWIGGVIFDRDRGYDCAERSVNITNIYYNRRGDYRGFYNGGPRYDRFNGLTERPISRFNLRREQGRAARQSIQTGRFNQINNQTLNVAAPRFSQANVRNGRVNFKNRGALPVTPVGREAAAANPANEAVREKARNTFRQQGEQFRTKNPNVPSVQRGQRLVARQGEGQPGIATTPQAQAQERDARRSARQEARQGGGTAPNLRGNPAASQSGQARSSGPSANVAKTGTKAERRATRQETRRQQSTANPVARSASGDHGAARTARQQAHEARRSARSEGSEGHRIQRESVPRVAREFRGRGAGGGGRALVGGGGGRVSRGGQHEGGGGHAREGGGGHGGGKKKG